MSQHQITRTRDLVKAMDVAITCEEPDEIQVFGDGATFKCTARHGQRSNHYIVNHEITITPTDSEWRRL